MNTAGENGLSQLADRFGIERGFWDARGHQITTSPDTQRRLLKAMGVSAETDSDAAESLTEAHRAAAANVLPPVVVSRQLDGACTVEIVAANGTAHVAWHIDLEDGSTRSGVADGANLKPAAPESEKPERLQLILRDLPWGYHQLSLPDLEARTVLIVTPGRCWLPESFSQGQGLWGIAAQLYLLRSEQNWGIGDFADLKELVTLAAAHGCDVIGLNPLHEMFLDNPDQASPYSPATRLYLNALFVSVPNVPEFKRSKAAQALAASAEFRARLAETRATTHVDYKAVADLKITALRLAFDTFQTDTGAERRADFETFRRERGASLERTALFQSLRQHFSAQQERLADWHNWGRELQDLHSDAVRAFAAEHRADIDFLIWLQWLADIQLGEAAAAADAAGMSIRLYRDLAVGCDQAGAETWANPDVFLRGVQVGAPPDIFNPAGQNWGLPPFHPKALQREAYGSFLELIRANMRHAGGLRIDHVMGLQHLYCIPEGEKPTEGAYIDYPIDDLLGVLALESQRHRCLVVGEDLGTVPEGFREKMAATNVLSYRVLFFEQDWDKGTFLPPERYPRLALAVTGSHDLPTLHAWWEGRDITQKEELGLYPSEDEAEAQRKRREKDKQALLQSMRQQGLIGSEPLSPDAFAQAAHAFLARTGAALVVPQLDDILGETEPVNVPGTTTQYPNWRRKYGQTLEELAGGQKDWARLADIPERRGAAR